MKAQDFSKIFFSILFLHLVVLYQPESAALYYISKPLLLFSLLAFFISNSQGFGSSNRNPVIFALVFSLLGDVLLMWEGQTFFLMGMAAFGVAQIAYSIFYFRQKLELNKPILFAAILFLAGILFVISRYLDLPHALSPYIYAYSVLIGIHLILSTRFLSAGIAKAKMATLGALLFVISDLILAFNEFGEPNKYKHIAVMLSYGLAQYFITMGLLDYLKSKEEISEHHEV